MLLGGYEQARDVLCFDPEQPTYTYFSQTHRTNQQEPTQPSTLSSKLPLPLKYLKG